MKQYLSIVGVVVVGLVAVAFFFIQKQGPVEEQKLPQDESSLPLITEIKGNIYVSKEGTERLLSNDERLGAPFDLRSEADSTAVVRLPNNSELRLDQHSKLTITDAQYGATDQSLVVRAKLSVGKVWSNITSLATPESAWEVETSNVVATVRGTAFGMEATETGDTTIIGSEHTVQLTLIDPETGARDTMRELPLNEDEFVTISNEIAKQEGTDVPKPQKRTDTHESDSWIRQNEERDTAERNDNNGADVETNTDVKVDSETEADTRTESLPDKEADTPVTSPTTPAVKPAVQTQVSTAPAPKPVSLSVAPVTPLAGIIEGAQVKFTATLKYDNGSVKDVSSEVAWSVVGKIGSMRGNTFTALLDPSISEFGKSSGSISAIWKDSVRDSQLLGVTPIFEVKANFTPLNTTEG